MIRIYGTTTSPYVRRVRIVAHELGLPITLVDTSGDQGQAELRDCSPIWKVPAASVDGELVLDSRVITEVLLGRAPDAPLARPLSLAERNAITVIDGALDSLINRFYLARDGVDAQRAPYLHKQRERAESAMRWIEEQLGDGRLGGDERFGLAELALATTADWMRFRGTYPVDDHPGIIACLERCHQRESFASTRPQA
jgi:glutathione S-transferase